MSEEQSGMLQCPHCRYQWESRSKSPRVCCPKCKKSFKKPSEQN